MRSIGQLRSSLGEQQFNLLISNIDPHNKSHLGIN